MMKAKSLGRIRKAIIPVAGLGTRLFTATRSLPKSLLPVIDSEGRIIPIIHYIVEEAIGAGIEHVGLIVNPDQRPYFEAYFHGAAPPEVDKALGLSGAYQSVGKQMQKFWCRIEFVTQNSPEGFGDAVFCARQWIGGEPFLLLLGDHLLYSATPFSCCQQLLQSFQTRRMSLVGMIAFPIKEAAKRGTAAASAMPNESRRYVLNRIIEKPTQALARKELRSPSLPKDQVFCLFGNYALTPTILKILEEDVLLNRRVRNEIQLTDALEILRQVEGCEGYEIEGESLDVGNPDDYIKAFNFLKSKAG
jgi:UTP--glucose-1-phosphate uridylyltransferase